MGNSVNQEKLISLNFILIEAFKWVVNVLVKVMLGRSFQLPEGVSGWRKEKTPATQKHRFVVETVGNLIGRIVAWGLKTESKELNLNPQNIPYSGQEPNCFSQPRQRLP